MSHPHKTNRITGTEPEHPSQRATPDFGRDRSPHRVCLRDRDASPDQAERPGLLAAVRRRKCPGLEAAPRATVDRPLAKVISQAMEQAGIHPSQRHRRVSDYLLERLLEERPGYQDW